MGACRARISLALLVTVCPTMARASQECTRRDAMKAEMEAHSVGTWDELYESFRRYAPQCDEASIGEAYSAAVERLLTERWHQLERLRVRTSTDATFRDFVINHIDATIPAKQLLLAQENARDHCPEESHALCESIVDRVCELQRQFRKDAIDE